MRIFVGQIGLSKSPATNKSTVTVPPEKEFVHYAESVSEAESDNFKCMSSLLVSCSCILFLSSVLVLCYIF